MTIFTPKFANFDNFPQKNDYHDNFFQKKCNFGQFSTSESKKFGEIFHNFLPAGENIDFFGRIFTYVRCTCHFESTAQFKLHKYVQTNKNYVLNILIVGH